MSEVTKDAIKLVTSDVKIDKDGNLIREEVVKEDANNGK